MKILQGILGLYIMFYIFYTPVYIFFFDDEEDAIKSISIADVIYKNNIEIGDSSGRVKGKKEIVYDFAKSYYKKTKIDLRESIYDTLNEIEGVKKLSIKKEFDKMRVPYLEGEVSGYVMRFTYENKNYEIGFAATEPSYLKVKESKAICAMDTKHILAMLGPIFGIPHNDIVQIVQNLDISLRMPN